MAVKEILKLGNPVLYNKSVDFYQTEVELIKSCVQDLHDTLIDFRNRFGYGRAIAAPQIGIMKRLIYMHIEKPIVFINPSLEPIHSDTFEVWDDCMSFPNLLVKVDRFRSCRISFKDINWIDQELLLNDDLSELIQHEYDHLEGILAVQLAKDQFSFALRGQIPI